MAATSEIQVPDIGDFKDVPIIEIHVKPGDAVKTDDPLITLECDKATMDVPAPRDGTVEELLVKVGDKVSEGTAILRLKGDGTAAGEAPVTQPPSVIGQQEPEPQPRQQPAPPPAFSPQPQAAGGAAARQLRRRPREPVGPPAGARARRRPHQGQGHGREGPRSPRRTCASFLRRPGGARRRGGGPLGRHGHPRDPGAGLLQVRPDRDQAAGAHQAHLGPAPAPRLAQRPACHPRDEADITEIEAYRKELDSAAKAQEEPTASRCCAFLMKASVSALQACSPSSTARSRPRRTR